MSVFGVYLFFGNRAAINLLRVVPSTIIIGITLAILFLKESVLVVILTAIFLLVVINIPQAILIKSRLQLIFFGQINFPTIVSRWLNKPGDDYPDLPTMPFSFNKLAIDSIYKVDVDSRMIVLHAKGSHTFILSADRGESNFLVDEIRAANRKLIVEEILVPYATDEEKFEEFNPVNVVKALVIVAIIFACLFLLMQILIT